MKNLKYFTIIGGAAVLALGTAAHFFYEWSGENFLVGMFSPVNESTWEHMKLVFFPMLLFAAAARLFLGGGCPAAAAAALCAGLLSTALIPVIFYTYSGVLGRTVPVLNIATFAAAVLIGLLVFFRLCKSGGVERFFPLLFCGKRRLGATVFPLHLLSAAARAVCRAVALAPPRGNLSTAVLKLPHSAEM